MFTKLKIRLIEDINVEKNPFQHRRLIMILALHGVSLFAFTIFIFINISLGRHILAFMDIALILITLFSVYLLLVKNNVEFAAKIASIVSFFFLLSYSYIAKNHSFGLAWTLCYPLFVIPILGTRKGVIMLSLFYLLLFPIAYSGIGEWDNGFWDKASFLRFLMASLTIAAIAYFFEKSSTIAYQTILEIREKERTYLSQLKELSITDQLTGLYNRRYFDEHFKLEKNKIHRYPGLLCLIMIDIDYFKSVNDQYGHQVGDNLLIEFSQLLKNSIRNTDFLSRWGGEEFVILLPETSFTNSINLAEKIRKNIVEHHFSKIGKISASFGVSQVESSPDSNMLAIHQADEALYKAKHQGRNKVVAYKSPSIEQSSSSEQKQLS